MLTTALEFLDWDDGTDTRYQLVAGEIIAVAPATDDHGTICGNLAVTIRPRLPRGFRGMLAVGLSIDRLNLYLADAVVTCSPPDDRGMPVDPILVVEVLSPSTRSFDIAVKAAAYSQIESVREIWLIDSVRRWVRAWRRAGDGWTVTLPILGEASFRSEVLGGEVGLGELYADTGL